MVPPLVAPFPPENIYAHTKKLRYIADELARLRRSRSGEIRVLDFGCGNGSAVSRYLMGEGIRYCGVDIHPESLRHARQHYGSERATFHEVVPEGVLFDAIVYADVLEHLPDPVATLREHARRLAPGGIIVGAVPNGYGPFEMEHRAIKLPAIRQAIRAAGRVRRALRGESAVEPGEQIPYNHESGHLQFFTRGALLRVLRDAGFRTTGFRHGSWVGAPVSERFLLRGERVARLNAAIADHLPHWAVSTWYFTAVRAGGGE